MSVVNQALAKGAKASHSRLSHIERIEVGTPKARPAWLWIILGFSVSLAVGGWSISLSSPDTAPGLVSERDINPQTPSPTQKISQPQVALYSAPVTEHSVTAKTATTSAQPSVSEPVTLAANHSKLVDEQEWVETETVIDTAAEFEAEPTNPLLANRTLASERADDSDVESIWDEEPVQEQEPSSTPVMVVERVELTAEQLAHQALLRAQKAMESNELQAAIHAYSEALRYTPNDETARQKLAALYYGKGEGRKAFDVMQAGIALNPNGEVLRLALAKLLVKEKQEAAALVPLAPLNAQPSLEYLALRAALAQKAKQDEMARESYQQLIEKDPNNGRWWLGLAIQQERALQWSAARQSYQQALSHVGLSNQSQAFIQQRLQLLTSLEETQGGH